MSTRIFLLLTVFFLVNCNNENVHSTQEIDLKMISIELADVFMKHNEVLNKAVIIHQNELKGIFQKYVSYDEFLRYGTSLEKEVIYDRLDIQNVTIDLTVVLSEINSRSNQENKFDQIESNIIGLMNTLRRDKSSREANPCDDACFQIKMAVWWSTFHEEQDAGKDMFQAAESASTASDWAYVGCMLYCITNPPRVD